jgi:hypothetical protein
VEWLRNGSEPTGTTAQKKVSRIEITELQQIPNIGPSIAADLRQLAILSPQDLPGKDLYATYD